MRKILLMAAVVMITVMSVNAQGLVGRIYYNANIMADELASKMSDLDKKLEKAKAEAIEKFEKEKGRKPTEAEKADIDKKLVEARDMAEAVVKGMTTKITVEFKTEKDAVMKADMKISEDALKAAGIGWLKRKAMKAALAIAPSTTKATYEVKGDLIIMNDDGDLDTLRMSKDGNYLYGKFDKKTNFKLTRTK